ncbi:ThuA domain-containing protein [Neolewinella litorea]|uniref:Carbohydrate-binding protein n=1 Tax=Neolewinella litorea TaxID=2562452 RepID=A0A4S4N8E0_9BACT|nr:ThuA domain-containing protein [Neolewinella litorea]THH34607.1 carbohydrate-binding protein [Neolewinella litorea]
MPHRLAPLFLLLTLALTCLISSCTDQPDQPDPAVLVFSKTEGFRHESIGAGQEALRQLAKEKNFRADFTEDAGAFTEANLSGYQAVVFLNTTGDVLDPKQQETFERYIQAGGGYVGVHSATDTEYEWPWYGQLAGAYFLDHPSDPSNVQTGRFTVLDTDSWATAGMPEEFEWTDEFYSFRNLSDHVHPVLAIDETSYVGGKNPDFHPMSWYHEFDGGRAFYTALGHTPEAYTEPLFLNHLAAGLHYAMGGDNPKPLDFAQSRPEENRFTKVVLAEGLDEPMELTLLDEDRILFIERKGAVKLYHNSTGTLETIATLRVSTVYTNTKGETSVAEDGLLGLNKDPDFASNQHIYLFYSDPDTSANVLARFTMEGDELLLDSKKVMLTVPVQREECCHTAGSIAFDAEGNLYLSTGDNTNPHASNGYSPSDERPGRSPWDAQKSSANTNDLRGKVLRITPQPDGSYTIPAGNLFPEGTEKTRPEIYTMGHRNPFRISVDPHTGYLYWGDVGPDASDPDSTRGPAGHDEVGQARQAGNYGWPHFVGDNKAYHRYDFATGTSDEKWDPAAPVNASPNNTGLEQLPPAQEAFIWYPYGASQEFPLVGNGGRNAMAGPVYYHDDFVGAERAFPPYYDGKLLAYEWMRGWIMAVTMDESGDLVSMERFMPNTTFNNPMDMAFADNGDLYMLEYGSGWFSQNKDARLIRIEYNAGNRLPQAIATADKAGGTLPLSVTLSAEEVKDADDDPLSFRWTVTSENGYSQTFEGQEVDLTLDESGLYQATLTVDDGQGGTTTSSVDISAGNAVPKVQLVLSGASRSFYTPGTPIDYAVEVSDAEDGKLGQGIDPGSVVLTMDYLPEGYDQVAIARGHRGADAGAMASQGESLIGENDCISCHALEKESIGPTWRAVAARYQDDPEAKEYLTGKIIAGGSGVWGENAMAAHPDLPESDAARMVDYIMSLNTTASNDRRPLQGSYTPELPEGDAGQGVLLLRAAYRDRGARGLPPVQAEDVLVLRNANVGVHDYDATEKMRPLTTNGMKINLVDGSGAYLMLRAVHLAGLQALTVAAVAPKPRVNCVGGKVELRIDSPTGPLLGTSSFLEPSEEMSFEPSFLTVAIQSPSGITDGPHDLYLVFVNEDEPEGTPMVVVGTEFKMASGGAGQPSR